PSPGNTPALTRGTFSAAGPPARPEDLLHGAPGQPVYECHPARAAARLPGQGSLGTIRRTLPAPHRPLVPRARGPAPGRGGLHPDGARPGGEGGPLVHVRPRAEFP